MKVKLKNYNNQGYTYFNMKKNINVILAQKFLKIVHNVKMKVKFIAKNVMKLFIYSINI